MSSLVPDFMHCVFWFQKRQLQEKMDFNWPLNIFVIHTRYIDSYFETNSNLYV